MTHHRHLRTRSEPLRLARLIPVILVIGALVPAAGSAQTPRFTIADVLDTKTLGTTLLSPDGRFAVATSGSLRDRIGIDNTRFGDPTYAAPSVAEARLIDTRTGESTPLFEGKRQVRGFDWSPDGTRLAWIERQGDQVRVMILDRATRRVRPVTLPADRVLGDGDLQWSGDGSRLIFGVRTAEWARQARERFLRETQGAIVVNTSDDPFLNWESIRRMGLRNTVVALDAATGKVSELLPEADQTDWALSEDATTLRWHQDNTKKTDYATILGRDNKLLVRPLSGDAPKVLLASLKDVTIRWSGDGLRYAYSKEGALFTGAVSDSAPKKLAGPPPAKPDSLLPDTTARRLDREARDRERFTVVRLSHTGNLLIASTNEAIWLFDVATGARERIVETPEESKTPDAPRYSVAAWSRDGSDIYLSYSSRTGWERGFARWDRAGKRVDQLVKDGNLYGNLQLSADGGTLLFTRAAGNQPNDVYVADRGFQQVRRLTELNPGIESKVSRTALIDYLDADGKKLRGVLYYPQDYREGTKYPTVFVVYETFFDDSYVATINFLTARGYAVMQPSVNLIQGYPGEAWLKGVTAAANKLIDLGLADKDKLAVQGTSYGGYATNLLVAQTDRFAAAINISGKANMVSFYTDSPRLGTRNTHAPERSQDRIGGTLWEQPMKYLDHSAVLMADRIKTPLLLMTGHEDHNVPERTTSEMYYALRRLGRRVEWVSYTRGGHGMPTTTVAEVEDYHNRIVGWYDRYLKKTPAATAAAGSN
jgi:dipeptidyl aminopeptidase/acylaminoacyl peptidase